jgi:hypothetical protein
MQYAELRDRTPFVAAVTVLGSIALVVVPDLRFTPSQSDPALALREE